MSDVPLDPMLPALYRVQRVRHEIPDTFSMELVPEDGSAIPPFATGQFNMLYVFGVGEIPISISGDPDSPAPLVHTTRAVGTVSRAMQELRAGDTIGVRGPFGTHWPIEQASGKDVVIVAGGIGLAPLRSTVVPAHRPARAVRESIAALWCANALGYALPSRTRTLARAPRSRSSTSR